MSRLRSLFDELGITQTKLAELIGRSQPSVNEWLKRDRIPAELVLGIEGATGVSRHDLRPDLYPLETNSPSTATKRKRA